MLVAATALQLWQKIPKNYQEQADFYTDLYEAYVGIVPDKQHRLVIKQNGLTNHIEYGSITCIALPKI